MAAVPQISSSAAWVRGVVAMFEAHGVDAPRLFEAAGLVHSDLKLAHKRFATDDVSRLWELAVAWTGEPALGLDRQVAARFVNFDIAAQAMWPAPDLRTGLCSFSRYAELIGDAALFRVDDVLGGAWLTLVHGNSLDLPRQRVEFGMLALLKLCRKVTHHPLKPQAMEFRHPPPADAHPHRMAFACPLRFGQPVCRMLLADADLDRPLAAGSSVFAAQERVIEKRLSSSGRLHTSYRTAEEIIRHLHLGPPDAARIARRLDLTVAALEKKLKAENTSFERLVDGVRRDLAAEYLADPGYLMARLPALLGYTATQEFAEACRRWFRASPAECRRMLHARVASA